MPLTTYKDKIYDSQEEAWFAMWCEELQAAGYIHEWEKCNNEIDVVPFVKLKYIKKTVLKTKTRWEEKEHNILNNLGYTPDFVITFTPNGLKFFGTYISHLYDSKKYFICTNCEYGSFDLHDCYIEVKPTFDKHGKTARFSIMQKIIWHVKKMFINLVITEDLFKDTFMPAAAMPDFTYKIKAKAGQWKTKYIPKTLKQFLHDK